MKQLAVVLTALSVLGALSITAASETRTKGKTDAPVTAKEIAAARVAFCRARVPGDFDIPRANRIYRRLTGADEDRAITVMGAQFVALTHGAWSLKECH